MSGCYKRVNFYDLCRLCAQNIQKNKIKIFEPEGQQSQLQSKIKNCLSINVKEDDFLPKVVCSKCIKQLEICNAFREECLNSETMLSTHFKKYRNTVDFKKSGQVYIKDTVKPEPAELVQSSTIKKIDTTTVLKPNQAPVIPPKPDDNTMCSNQTSKNQNIINKKFTNAVPHIQPVQLPYNIDLINEALKKAVQQLPKELLNKVIVNASGEVIHLAPQDPVNIDTPQVPQNINNNGNTSVIKSKFPKRKVVERLSQNLNRNIIKIDLTDDDNVEDTNASADMPYCKNNQSCAQNPTVIFPVPHQYQNNNFAPAPTSNIYPQQTAINIPPPTNSTVINVICSNAPEQAVPHHSPPSSINMDDLRSPQNYIPPVPTVLKRSVKSENGKPTNTSKNDDLPKIHACEVCSKTFKRREHLYQHIKLHTGFRPYQCTECKKTFVRKEHLLRHMVLHSGERNFSCDICTKSFSRHDNLLKHIRTHNKEPTFTCDVCQKVFIIKHYYDSHRSEHGKCFLPSHLRNNNC